MTEQEKRAKVIAEIERVADEANPWKESPPLRCDISYPLLIDALALLKAQEPCEDAVSRKDVINVLHSPCDMRYVNGNWHPCIGDYIEAITNLSAVAPKAHEPRLVTSKDFESNPNVDDMGNLPVWIEYRRDSYYENILKDCHDGWCIALAQTIKDSHSMRCWTSRPTDEQMEATPWE